MLAATRTIEFAGRTADFEIHSDTAVIVTSPAGSGDADIVVTTTAGRSAAAAASRFTYTNALETPSFRVVSQALIPPAPTSFATDVTGDGVLRNQFGMVLKTIDVQAQSDIAFGNHAVDYILRLDAMSAGVNVVLLEAGAPVATFPGTFANGIFISNDPLSTRQSIMVALPLAALGLAKTGRVRLAVCRIKFDLTKKSGQITGSFRWTRSTQWLFRPSLASSRTS